MSAAVEAKNKKTTHIIKRSALCIIFSAIGAVLVALGILLRMNEKNPTNDVTIFIAIIGGILILYGVSRILKTRTLGSTIEVSNTDIKNFFTTNAIILVLLVMIVILSIYEPKFLQIRAFVDIFRQSSVRLILALGVSFVLLTGGTDLSAGRVAGLAAVIAASLMQVPGYSRPFWPGLAETGFSIALAVLIAVFITTIFGFINGSIVSRLSLPPFIATLGTQVIVYGICSIYFAKAPNNSQPIGGIREDFKALGQTQLFNSIPILVVIALVFAVVVWFVQNKTVFGKNIYAVGGNVEAARVSGINVIAVLIGCYTIAGFCYGCAGVLEAARNGGATNNYCQGYELDAIASCVVGGVSLNGGVGKVSGVIIGVLIFNVIAYGLSFVGLNPYYQQIAKGLIIIVAVAIDIRKYLAKR